MDIGSRPSFRGHLLWASIMCSGMCAFVHLFLADGCTTIGACMDPVLVWELMHAFFADAGYKGCDCGQWIHAGWVR